MPVCGLVCVIYILPWDGPIGPYLSYPLRQTANMRLNLLGWLKPDDGETLALFGDARLVKKLNGEIELVGGSAEDRTAAREWVSLFLHEARV